MKAFFVFTMAVMCCCTTQSQPTSYNPDLDKFEGNWIWTSGNDTVKIVLEKQLVFQNLITPRYQETIVGWHKYVKNGIVKEDFLSFIGYSVNSGQNDDIIRETMTGQTQTPQKLYLPFIDATLNKTEELWLTYISNTPPQLVWRLRENRGMYVGTSGNFAKITLPKDLLLTKVP